jgi:hypothetical protein
MRSLIFLTVVAACHNDNPTPPMNDLSVPTIVDMASGTDATVCNAGDPCLVAGMKSVCKANACGQCTDTTDDAACTAAWGGSDHYICSGGVCSIGCRSSADCNGQICGITIPNMCGACTSDAQCAMALGAGNICNTSTGKCVSNACTTVSTACAANSADFCCAIAGNNVCVPGVCCTNSDCTNNLSCVNHVCTTCPSPSPGLLAVDPAQPPGAPPTGADIDGCRYKLITDALNTFPSPAATIKVYGTANLTGNDTTCANHTGECLPIMIPDGVTITGASPAPTLVVPINKNGFVLDTPGAVLRNFTLEGANGSGTPTGNIGIVSDVGLVVSPSPAPAIDHVTIQNFNADCINAGGTGAVLSINGGVTAKNCASGLNLTASSFAAIKGAGADTITFVNNRNQGVIVNNSTLNAVGTPKAAGFSSLEIISNAAGMTVQSGTVNMSGAVIASNTANGVAVQGGANLTLRSCYILKNGAAGIDVFGSGSLASVDIGTSGDFGRNTLQAAGPDANVGTGICNTTSHSLEAEGNFFNAVDCTQSPSPSPSPVAKGNSCTTGASDVANTSTGTTNVSNCVVP